MEDRTKFLLAAALGLGLGLSACASQPPAQTAEEPAAKRNCLRETGTRIEAAEGECVNASGRVYTAEDLQQSGSPTVSDALRRMRR